MENVMPFRIRRQHLDKPTDVRRTIETLTPNILCSTSLDDSPHLSSVDHHDDISQAISPVWSAKSFVHATSNLAQDPSSWLQLDDTAASPIRVGDSIICPDADTTVISVSPKGPMVQIDGTNEKFCILPFLLSTETAFVCCTGIDHYGRENKGCSIMPQSWGYAAAED